MELLRKCQHKSSRLLRLHQSRVFILISPPFHLRRQRVVRHEPFRFNNCLNFGPRFRTQSTTGSGSNDYFVFAFSIPPPSGKNTPPISLGHIGASSACILRGQPKKKVKQHTGKIKTNLQKISIGYVNDTLSHSFSKPYPLEVLAFRFLMSLTATTIPTVLQNSSISFSSRL